MTRQLNAHGRDLVSHAITVALHACGELPATEPETHEAIAELIRVTLHAQVTRGEWISMGIETPADFGGVRVFVEICNGAGRVTVALPAFIANDEVRACVEQHDYPNVN